VCACGEANATVLDEVEEAVGGRQIVGLGGI